MVKVFVSKRGQFRLTIPKHIVDILDLKHRDALDFILEKGLWRIKKGNNVKVHFWNNNQVKINLPKELANRMKLYPNCELKFRFGNGWFIELG